MNVCARDGTDMHAADGRFCCRFSLLMWKKDRQIGPRNANVCEEAKARPLRPSHRSTAYPERR